MSLGPGSPRDALSLIFQLALALTMECATCSSCRFTPPEARVDDQALAQRLDHVWPSLAQDLDLERPLQVLAHSPGAKPVKRAGA
jgi:hypothetical protein